MTREPRKVVTALRREDGQGATEYGLVLALVLLSLAATVVVLAGSIVAFLEAIASLVGALAP